MYSMVDYKKSEFVKMRFATVWGARLYAFVNHIREYAVFPFQRYVMESDAVYSTRKKDVEPPLFSATGNVHIDADSVKRVQNAALRLSRGEPLLVSIGG